MTLKHCGGKMQNSFMFPEEKVLKIYEKD